VPLYEYECKKDGRFELIRKFSDPPVTACPTCGQPIEKLLSSPAIQFKGSGWYITDYARKGGEGAAKESGKDAKDSGKESSAKPESSRKESSAKGSASKSDGSTGSPTSSNKASGSST
jgi:putative FmdB family regulatory protein